MISVIIVSWNGKKWLKKCLDSLRAQTYKRFEVIFVDNASSDDSVEFVRTNYPEVLVVKNDKNAGFAGGNNLGLRYAKGKYVLLLNNDTWVVVDYLEKFIECFKEIPNAGCVQSKIVLMDNPEILDVCGAYWTNSTFLYYYGHGQSSDLPKYNEPIPFFSNKGASMMIKREVLAKTDGLFDDDFWCYYEETDFCHRVWLSGYECWYYPKAVAYHANGGTSLNFQNELILFHSFKNKLLSFLKNFQIYTLALVIPAYILLNTGLSLYWLLQGKVGNFLVFYKSLWWNVVNFSDTFRKRQKVQLIRKKTDREIARKIKKAPRWIYYYYLLTGLEKYNDV